MKKKPGQKKPERSDRPLSAPLRAGLDSKTRLILFGGKGGVGKTTCAAATALHLAMSGSNILVVSSDPAPSLSDIFEQNIGSNVTKIHNNLHAIEIDPQHFIDEFKDRYGDVLFEIMSSIIPIKREDMDIIPDEVAPGFDDLLAMEYLISNMIEGYDTIIWDTAPTGHTLRLLHLPVSIRRYAEGGMKLHSKISRTLNTIKTWFDKDTSHDAILETLQGIIQSAEVIKQILSDGNRTQFVPVVIPEGLALSQTDRLIHSLDEHGIRIMKMIINGVVPDSNCRFCISRRKMQLKYIDKFHRRYDDRMCIIEMQLFPEEIRGMDALSRYAGMLCGGDVNG